MTQFQLFAPTDSVSAYGRFVDAVYAAQERMAGGHYSEVFAAGEFESDDDGREFFSFSCVYQGDAEQFASYVEFYGCDGASLLVA